ncbi:MAG TPA: hypothetical protein VLI05_05070 [Candidatus Saccharimonadia bacterium]|nr:hypothetical protein [Candidatus Saccharimonadia bacterium]
MVETGVNHDEADVEAIDDTEARAFDIESAHDDEDRTLANPEDWPFDHEYTPDAASSYTYVLRDGELYSLKTGEDGQVEEVPMSNELEGSAKEAYQTAVQELEQGAETSEYLVRWPAEDRDGEEAYVRIVLTMTADGRVTMESDPVIWLPKPERLQDDDDDGGTTAESNWTMSEPAAETTLLIEATRPAQAAIKTAASALRPAEPPSVSTEPVSLLDWVTPAPEEGTLGVGLAEVVATAEALRLTEPSEAELPEPVAVADEAITTLEPPMMAAEVSSANATEITAEMPPAPAELEAGQVARLRPAAEAAPTEPVIAAPPPEPPAPIDGGDRPGATVEFIPPQSAPEAAPLIQDVPLEKPNLAHPESSATPDAAVISPATTTERANEQPTIQVSEAAPTEVSREGVEAAQAEAAAPAEVVMKAEAPVATAGHEARPLQNEAVDELVEQPTATREAVPITTTAEPRRAQVARSEPTVIAGPVAVAEQANRQESTLGSDEPAIHSLWTPIEQRTAKLQPPPPTRQAHTEPVRSIPHTTQELGANPMEAAHQVNPLTPLASVIDETEAELSFEISLDGSRRRHARRSIATSVRRTA